MIPDSYEEITSLVKVRGGLQNQIEKSALGQEYSGSVQNLCNYLDRLRKTGYFKAMFNAEQALIAHDTVKAASREPQIIGEMQSMARAERQLVQALKCHEQLTTDKDAYKDSPEYFSDLDSKGYPKDSCRKFLGSQNRRIIDSLKHPHDDNAVNVFKARRANIEAMKRLYEAMQASSIEKRERGIEDINASQAESRKFLSSQSQKIQESA